MASERVHDLTPQQEVVLVHSIPLVISTVRCVEDLIGYQFGSTDAFSIDDLENNKRTTIDEPYVDGISITNGMPCTHIWTFAAGASENGSCISLNCPCSNGNHLQPSYVGSNYYCESAYQDDCYMSGVFFFGDPLWDGQQCDNEGTCCTSANNPPWFSVDLSDSTSEDIEVCIRHNQPTTDEDIYSSSVARNLCPVNGKLRINTYIVH